MRWWTVLVAPRAGQRLLKPGGGEAATRIGSAPPTGLGWPAEMRSAPARRSSVTSRDSCRWKVPLARSTRPFASGLERAKICSSPSSAIAGSVQLGRRRRLMRARYILEDGVAVTVQGQRNPTTPQLLHEEEIAMSVLFHGAPVRRARCWWHHRLPTSRVHRGPRSSSQA